MKHAFFTLPLALASLTACIPDIMNTKPEVRGLEGAALVQHLSDPIDRTEIKLRPGGQFELKLASNPTTGYFWYVKEQDETLLSLISEDYASDPNPGGMTGVGGNQIFVFEALAPGKTNLTLSYERHPEDVAETLSLKIETLDRPLD